jgi:hypothetical protein
MKKLIILQLFFLCVITSFGQEVTKDSILYKNRYYQPPDPEYEALRSWLNLECDDLNFEAYFIPGLGYTYYRPKGIDSTGMFNGIAVNYLIYSKM